MQAERDLEVLLLEHVGMQGQQLLVDAELERPEAGPEHLRIEARTGAPAPRWPCAARAGRPWPRGRPSGGRRAWRRRQPSGRGLRRPRRPSLGRRARPVWRMRRGPRRPRVRKRSLSSGSSESWSAKRGGSEAGMAPPAQSCRDPEVSAALRAALGRRRPRPAPAHEILGVRVGRRTTRAVDEIATARGRTPSPKETPAGRCAPARPPPAAGRSPRPGPPARGDRVGVSVKRGVFFMRRSFRPMTCSQGSSRRWACWRGRARRS